MCVHCCNPKFYSTYIFSYCKIKSCVSGDTTKERYPLIPNLLYNTCPITPQNVGTNNLCHTACTTSKESCMSDNATKETRRFFCYVTELVMLDLRSYLATRNEEDQFWAHSITWKNGLQWYCTDCSSHWAPSCCLHSSALCKTTCQRSELVWRWFVRTDAVHYHTAYWTSSVCVVSSKPYLVSIFYWKWLTQQHPAVWRTLYRTFRIELFLYITLNSKSLKITAFSVLQYAICELRGVLLL
jgi:hypothetical protein